MDVNKEIKAAIALNAVLKEYDFTLSKARMSVDAFFDVQYRHLKSELFVIGVGFNALNDCVSEKVLPDERQSELIKKADELFNKG